MLYYYAMNRSGQYLGRDMLWGDNWGDHVLTTITVPKHDTGIIGIYEVYEITEEEILHLRGQKRLPMPKLANIPGPYVILSKDSFWSKLRTWHAMMVWDRDRVMTFPMQESAELYIKTEGLTSAHVVQMEYRDFRDGKKPKPFNPKTDFEFVLKYGLTEDELKKRLLEPMGTIAPSKRDAFFEEYAALTEKYKIRPFSPNFRYNHDGDQLEVYITDELSYCDPVAPGLLVLRTMETKAITGVKIQDFLNRMCGADPSRQAMIMDIEMVNIICEWYEERIKNNGPAWTWKPEELEFFHAVHRAWPGMKHKFLTELPRVTHS